MCPFLNQLFSSPDPGLQAYSRLFRKMEIPAKHVLLREGTIPHRFFFIEKGCIRAWYNKEGKDITFQFFFENQTVASIESMKKGMPSPVTLEVLEPSVVWWMEKKDMEQLLQYLLGQPAQRQQVIDYLFERTFTYMNHFFSFIRDSPRQRYLNLMESRPEIIRRIPQHYIASYLGITPVHLSRIKRALAKEKS